MVGSIAITEVIIAITIFTLNGTAILGSAIAAATVIMYM